MSYILQLTPHDSLIARDGRPFGAGQGNRMRSLPWPLPSVVAGSFRSALVKGSKSLDYSGDMPQRLMQIAVAGVFPVHDGKLYLPAPNDAVAEPGDNGLGIKEIHRVSPREMTGGCDFPIDGLKPAMLSIVADFKPAEVPAWWPVSKLAEWLLNPPIAFDSTFLKQPIQETRDHVCLDANLGAAAEGQNFATSGLNATHLPRFGVKSDDKKLQFVERFASVTLTARVTNHDTGFEHSSDLNIWHPLGGERRLVHWQQANSDLWKCPDSINDGLKHATQIRMVLATPAVFKDGWKPGWLNDQLEGTPPACDVKLKLVGVSNGRWKAVSGWALAATKGQPRGPKPIRRMVPAGSVYFFKCEKGSATELANQWLQPVSDDEQERRDGFGLAIWGTW